MSRLHRSVTVVALLGEKEVHRFQQTVHYPHCKPEDEDEVVFQSAVELALFHFPWLSGDESRLYIDGKPVPRRMLRQRLFVSDEGLIFLAGKDENRRNRK